MKLSLNMPLLLKHHSTLPLRSTGLVCLLLSVMSGCMMFIHGKARQPIVLPPVDESVDIDEVFFEDSFDSAFLDH